MAVTEGVDFERCPWTSRGRDVGGVYPIKMRDGCWVRIFFSLFRKLFADPLVSACRFFGSALRSALSIRAKKKKKQEDPARS